MVSGIALPIICSVTRYMPMYVTLVASTNCAIATAYHRWLCMSRGKTVGPWQPGARQALGCATL